MVMNIPAKQKKSHERFPKSVGLSEIDLKNLQSKAQWGSLLTEYKLQR